GKSGGHIRKSACKKKNGCGKICRCLPKSQSSGQKSCLSKNPCDEKSGRYYKSCCKNNRCHKSCCKESCCHKSCCHKNRKRSQENRKRSNAQKGGNGNKASGDG
ncbi:MAG: hypothetical protein LBJ57_08905, partial [Prevotellaceae bacterium]|nr:hypothetical protein [Prevotellaceae bacterium]